VLPWERAIGGQLLAGKKARQDRRFFAPATSNSISPQQTSAGSVSVTRGPKGSTSACGTPITHRSVSRKGRMVRKQRGSVAVTSHAHQHQIEQRARRIKDIGLSAPARRAAATFGLATSVGIGWIFGAGARRSRTILRAIAMLFSGLFDRTKRSSPMNQ
jgi:hypothetical protein